MIFLLFGNWRLMNNPYSIEPVVPHKKDIGGGIYKTIYTNEKRV